MGSIQHLSEIVGDIASAAVRGARINIDMEEFRDGVFPVFTRMRRGRFQDDAIEEDESDDGRYFTQYNLGRQLAKKVL